MAHHRCQVVRILLVQETGDPDHALDRGILIFTKHPAGTAGLGYFRDIKNASGAITGLEYLNATEEIAVQAALKETGLRAEIAFIRPDDIPYREVEELTLHEYDILDVAGNILLSGTETDPVSPSGGQAVIEIPLSLPEDARILAIRSFTAYKKADQPLNIYGAWQCPIE